MSVPGFLIISRGIAAAILASCVLIGSEVSWGQSYRPSKEQVQILAREIKKTAQEVMNASWIDATKTYIYIGEKREARFYTGGVGGALGFGENDPWGTIYEWQIDFELLNQFFQKDPQTWFIWERNRQKGEQLILQAIGAVLSGQRDIEREQFYYQFEEPLQEDMHKYLRERGYTIASEMGNGMKEHFQVKVIIEPQGGKVMVLPYLVYKKCQMLGQNPKEWPWRTLLGINEKLLMGKYNYIAMWPDGQHDSGAIEVMTDTSLVFRPMAR